MSTLQVTKLINNLQHKELLEKIGVDKGALQILLAKMQHYLIYITNLDVGGANILKQDALSIGADLAVPRGTVVASIKKVDCVLIGTKKHLEILSRKELAQPFGLKEVAKELKNIISMSKSKDIEVMGIINANDDSFFSNSRFLGTQAIEKLHLMVQEGANIIDIGGVSSRPNASKVSSKEELERMKPIIDSIYQHKLYENIKFSVDSYTPEVVSYALERGFKIVNDITGLRDDAISKLCASYDATAVIMHMQGTPQTMQDNPFYGDVIDEVYNYFQTTILNAESLGVKDIIIDVGIGFGKTLEHNLSLIKNLEYFLLLNKPILIGASRKSMINTLYPSNVQERLPGTLALHLEAVKNGASIVRVHDVKEHKQALSIQKEFL